MKNTMKVSVLAVALAISVVGCKSEAEKLQEQKVELENKQRQVCKEGIEKGEQPTEFCLNLLPEYRQIFGQAAPQQQYAQQQPVYQDQPVAQQAYPEQQYAPQQQPVQQVAAAPQPVYVQGQPSTTIVQGHDNTGMDAFVGSMAGSMVGNALTNGGGYGRGYNGGYDVNHSTSNVTKNVTINKTYVTADGKQVQQPTNSAPAAAQSQQQAPKPASAMDMSKLNAYGARPAASTQPQVAKPSGFDTSKFGNMGARPAASTPAPQIFKAPVQSRPSGFDTSKFGSMSSRSSSSGFSSRSSGGSRRR